MKKNLIFMLSLLMTLTTAFVFSSCEKEENGKEEVIKDRSQWGTAIVGNWVCLKTVPGKSNNRDYKTTYNRTLILNADGTGSWDSKETTVFSDDNSSKESKTKFSFTWTYEVDESAIYPSSLKVKVTSSESDSYEKDREFNVTVYEVTKNSLTFFDDPFGMYTYKRK